MTRSELMARIRSSGTKPELTVATALRRLRVRFRGQDCSLPGRPDFALWGRRTALFVDGCFWHGHRCQGRRPKADAARRAAKLDANIARDGRNRRALMALGWWVAVVHECELRGADVAALVAGRIA